MDSPLPEFLPLTSMSSFATMPSHRARHGNSSHRSSRRAATNIGSGVMGDAFPYTSRFHSAAGMRLSASAADGESNVAPAPADGTTTRSRKRKHSEAEQNHPESEAPNSDSQPSPVPAATRGGARKTSSKYRPRLSQVLKKAPPGSAAAKVSSDDDEDDVEGKKPAAVDNCCICMSDVEFQDAALINGCDHRFCFTCIERWAERENSCPLCKQRFTKIDRVNKRKKKGTKNSKSVKQRDQRTDLVSGVAIEGLIGKWR
jgi:Ring finger domain